MYFFPSAELTEDFPLLRSSNPSVFAIVKFMNSHKIWNMSLFLLNTLPDQYSFTIQITLASIHFCEYLFGLLFLTRFTALSNRLRVFGPSSETSRWILSLYCLFILSVYNISLCRNTVVQRSTLFNGIICKITHIKYRRSRTSLCTA